MLVSYLNILTNIPLNLYVLYVNGSFMHIIIAELIIIVVETLWLLLCEKMASGCDLQRVVQPYQFPYGAVVLAVM